MKTNGEVCALSVYEEPHGISDRLILSLAPAAILVPPPKMAFTIVWLWIRTRLELYKGGATAFCVFGRPQIFTLGR